MGIVHTSIFFLYLARGERNLTGKADISNEKSCIAIMNPLYKQLGTEIEDPVTAKLVASGSSLKVVDLPKRDQPIFVKVAAA